LRDRYLAFVYLLLHFSDKTVIGFFQFCDYLVALSFFILSMNIVKFVTR
jgi:hypothetical protein